jgi:predicted DsbA family dithiol-disulfide isomerase
VRIEQLQKNFEIGIKWIAFPLHPETPADGQTLEQLFAGRSIDLEKSKVRLKQVADELGLPWGDRTMTYNSRLAQEVAKWAESRGKGDPFHEAVFRAYYVDGINIGKIKELVSLAKSVGLPEKEARSVLESRPYREAVDADWSRSHQLGITGVPTFVIGHQAIVGFQPYENLAQLLKTNGANKKRRGL